MSLDHAPLDHGSGSKPVEEEGAPSWIVTFSDLMSLLLTFFILLYSMSELRVDRFLLASQSLREAMGSTGETPPEDPTGLLPPSPDSTEVLDPGAARSDAVSPPEANSNPDGTEDPLDTFTDAYMRMLAARLDSLTAAQGLDARTVEVIQRDDGVYLRIRDAVLFESGEAALGAEGRSIIGSLADVTSELEIPTVVSGHADDRPIATDRYPSNWELSAARAAGVARFLVTSGQSPASLQVHSFGQYQPVADNATAAGRARNRRVELFFSRDEIRRAAARLLRAGARAGEVSGGV